jgi:hypothetical protein
MVAALVAISVMLAFAIDSTVRAVAPAASMKRAPSNLSVFDAY